jgi:hypothetical protein
MIDVQVFQTFLLIVCILAFIGAVFACVIIESARRWLHVLIKLFYATLGVASGFAGLMLVMLK